MCLYQMTRQQLNRRLTALGCASILMAAGMAVAAEFPTVSAAERMDRLGAVGLLSIGFVTVTGAFIAVLRLAFGRMLSVLERNSEEIARAAEIGKQTNQVMGRMIDSIKDCDHARNSR